MEINEEDEISKKKKVIKNKLAKHHIAKSTKVRKNEALLPKVIFYHAAWKDF